MDLPSVSGQHPATDFYIYSACDSLYFDQFAVPFFRSAQQNADLPVHLHIFNPRQDQLETCARNGVSVTWEDVSADQFTAAASKLSNTGGEPLRRTQVAMHKGGDADITERVIKTYYACARFVRLNEMFDGPVFACDIDAVIRKPIPSLKDQDFYIHQIFGDKARFLAGGLYLNNNQFLSEYAQELKHNVNNDWLYWSIDQDVMDPLVPKHQHGQLPAELIDWNMNSNSVVWTAKGTRKDLEVFKLEQLKYTA
jgi:hypothetical protein